MISKVFRRTSRVPEVPLEVVEVTIEVEVVRAISTLL